PYHFAALAADVSALLDSLGLAAQPVVLLGHSTGGMLAAHFALLYPGRVAKLVLEDPIGLEDYSRLAPPQSTETLYQAELKNRDPVKIAAFFARYFTEPRPDLVPDLAKVPVGVAKSRDFPTWAKASARAYQMIYTEPVIERFAAIATPTLLVVGAEDHAAPFAAYAAPEIRSTMGQNAALAQAAAATMPHARLEIIPECGHIPHLERPTAFKKVLFDFLNDPLTPNP
ncbi:MAG TPA: alpha/beta hydrolase, partial [Candidatus Methylacidiphilales bacterium]